MIYANPPSKITPIFPVGTRVRIINADAGRYIGCYAAVVEDNPEDLERPKIVVYETRYHKKIKPFMVDLADNTNMQIEAVL